MAKRRKRKAAAGNADRVDPREVLAGRVEVDAGLLLDLIHRVNPTGLGVPAGEQRSRYQLKSALQSLLVERFADELEFEAEPGSDGVARIHHRYGARDACHAVLSELGADARFLVRRRLDERASDRGEGDEQPQRPAAGARLVRVSEQAEAPGHAAGEGEGDDALSAGELLARGNAALEAYRYDEAERFFRLAVERSGGEVEAAGALFGLLVDHLAAYAGALQVAAGLPLQTMREPLLRVLAGRAAAGCGRPELALQYVENIRTGGAAEVHAALASTALREGELEQAARHLARANEIARDAAAAGDVEAAPLLLETDRLAAEIDQKRAWRREPEEREVEKLLERGELGQAEQQARRLLEHWPESRAARVVLRLIEDDRKQEQVRELVALADRAAAAGDFARALQLLAKAAGAGGDSRALQERMENAEQRLRSEQESAEVQRVSAVLRGEERLAGLLAYLALDDGLRERVRERAALEPLSWLEQQGGGRRTGARARADAEAVLALQEAAAAMEQGHADQALALIEPHQGLLRGVATARNVAEQARQQLAERRQQRAAGLVGSAREALERGEHREALRLLQEVEARILPETERRLADELVARAGRLAERERLVETYRGRLDAGELLQARDALRWIADLAEGPERAAWVREQERLAAGIRRKWRVRIIDGPAAGRIDLRDFDPASASQRKAHWLTPDGRRMVAAAASGRWLFLRVVETATSRVQTAVLLRTPEPLGSWPMVSVQEGSVCVLGQDRLVELSLQSWEILRWCDYGSLPGLRRDTDALGLMPGGRLLWVDAFTADGGWKTVVLDLEQRLVRRALPGYFFTRPLCVRGRTLVLCSDEKKTRLYTETGAVFDFRIPTDQDIEDAVFCPDANGIALLARARSDRAGDAGTASAYYQPGDDLLAAMVALPDGTSGPCFFLKDTDPDLIHHAATSSSAGLLFVTARCYDALPRLWALRADGQELGERYRVLVFPENALVQNLDGSHAALVEEAPDALRVLPLSGSAPPGRPESEEQCDEMAVAELLPKFTPPFFCWRAPREHRAFSLALMGILADTPPEKRAEKIEQFFENNRDEPESLLSFHDMLGPKGLWAEAKQLEEPLAGLSASCPAAAFPLAERHCREQRWKQVAGLLEPLVPAALERPDGEHLCHLLVIALIAGRRPVEAAELLRRAVERYPEKSCGLESYLELTEPLPSPLLPEYWGPGAPRLRQLAGAVAVADDRLAAGDLQGARQAIDRRVVWCSGELQSLARLAELFLQLDESGDEETLFFKVRALGELCAAQQQLEDRRDLPLVRDLPFFGRTWSRERIGELAARACAWLEGWKPTS